MVALHCVCEGGGSKCSCQHWNMYTGYTCRETDLDVYGCVLQEIRFPYFLLPWNSWYDSGRLYERNAIFISVHSYISDLDSIYDSELVWHPKTKCELLLTVGQDSPYFVLIKHSNKLHQNLAGLLELWRFEAQSTHLERKYMYSKTKQ